MKMNLYGSLMGFLILAVANARSPTKPIQSSCQALPFVTGCDASGYDGNTAPELASSGGATPVKIQIYLENVARDPKIPDNFELDFYFIEFWNDTRLVHTHTRFLQLNTNEQIEKIWRPDFYFANARETKMQQALVPNRFIKIHQDGAIRLSTRIQAKLPCKKDVCTLKIVSYGNTKDTLLASWIDSDKPIQLNPEIADRDLTVGKTDSKTCAGAYFDKSFNCLTATFTMKAK